MTEVNSMRIEDARPYYERFFQVFPTAGRYWKFYAEHELKFNNTKRAETIFRKCLMNCLNVELWKSYLQYIESRKNLNPISVQNMPESAINQGDLDEVIRAYKYACDHVGKDVNSTDIWRNLIRYMKLQKSQYNMQFDHQNKLKSIRDIYQRILMIPMHDLNNVWHEYEQFENEFAKPMAKQVLSENMPRYKLAWTKYKEKKNIREGLLLNMLARPPSGLDKEEQQKKIWRHLIAFEKRNTQRLSIEEVRQRVMFTYEQALLCLYHYPEIWYEAAMYLASYSAHDEASRMFERAVKALPDNILIHFAYADYEETKKNFDKAAQIYEDLMKHRQDSIVTIQYQKFVRRRFGVDRARQVFIQAIKNEKCTYHVYVASALMEFQVNDNAPVAVKVFERGLKNPSFMNEPAYILQYLKLLEHMNDRNNTRVLFKKVLGSMPKDKSLEIWNKYLEFEYGEGDPNVINEVEASKSEAISEDQQSYKVPDKKYIDIVNRFKFMDLWPCTTQEIETMDVDDEMETDKVLNQATAAQQQQKQGLKRSSRIEKEQARQTINKFKHQFYKPDVGKMLKITPTESQLMSRIVNSDGLPEAVANIFNMMPVYHGPLPDIEYVMATLRNNPLPDMGDVDAAMPARNLKRERSEDDEEEEESSTRYGIVGGVGAPRTQNDIYQMRRKKMQRTMAP